MKCSLLTRVIWWNEQTAWTSFPEFMATCPWYRWSSEPTQFYSKLRICQTNWKNLKILEVFEKVKLIFSAQNHASISRSHLSFTTFYYYDSRETTLYISISFSSSTIYIQNEWVKSFGIFIKLSMYACVLRFCTFFWLQYWIACTTL